MVRVANVLTTALSFTENIEADVTATSKPMVLPSSRLNRVSTALRQSNSTRRRAGGQGQARARRSVCLLC